MSTLLDIDRINLSYGNIRALKDIRLHVDEGEIVCLIGANGAGKSSLLKAIVGLEALEKGRIVFKGKVLNTEEKKKRLRTDQIAREGISLVPEGRRVFKDMTVKENLEMGAFQIKDHKEINRKIREMYDFFPILKDRASQKTNSLSGGEQQMMAIARSLMSSPKLLLLDEPGLGLAPLIVKDIFEKITFISRSEKVTILLVEQNARMALHISQRGYVLENGEIVLSGSGPELLHSSKVREAYLGG